MRRVEQFIRDAEPQRLTSDERSLMRARLVAFMDAHPAAVASPYAPVVSPISAESVRVRSFAFVQRHYVQAFLAVILIIGGGMSAAAQAALPGDALYAVKVAFNEEVPAIFAVTPEAKAKHEVRRAEARLKEAATLSAQGRLTEEVRGEIEADFESHVKNTERQVRKLASADEAAKAVEVNSELEIALRVHERVLADLTDRSEGAGEVASLIRQELTGLSRSLDKLEDQLSNEVSADSEDRARRKSLDAEKGINDAKAYAAGAGVAASAEARADAERHLQLSIRYLGDAYGKLGEGSFNKSFVLFQKSLKHSTEAELILSASVDLGIEGEEAEEEVPEPALPEPVATTTEPVIVPDDTASSTATSTVSGDTDGATTTTVVTTSDIASDVLSTSSLDIEAARTGIRQGIQTEIRNLLKLRSF